MLLQVREAEAEGYDTPGQRQHDEAVLTVRAGEIGNSLQPQHDLARRPALELQGMPVQGQWRKSLISFEYEGGLRSRQHSDNVSEGCIISVRPHAILL